MRERNSLPAARRWIGEVRVAIVVRAGDVFRAPTPARILFFFFFLFFFLRRK